MEKLNAKQILEIIENNFEINDWAYGEFGAPDDFTPSPATLELKNKFKELDEKKQNHPGYNSYQNRDKEWDEIISEQRSVSYWEKESKEYLEYLGLGEIKEVDSYGGEGQGETWYSVKYFPKHDIYIRIDGFYTSYDGTYFDEGYGYEVFPQTKTITVFEKA